MKNNIVKTIFLMIQKHKKLLNLILIILAPLPLLNGLKPYKESDFFHLRTQVCNKNILMNKPVEFTEKSPYETICIIIPPEYVKLSYLVKNIVKYICCRPRSIIITNKDTYQQYYLKVFLRPGPYNMLEIFPLSNDYCDMNFHSFFINFYPTKLRILPNLILKKLNVNSIYLCITEDYEGLANFIEALRYCMNPEIFTSSIYFYIPFKNSFLTGEAIIIFIIILIGILLYDVHSDIDPIKIIIFCFISYYFPYIALIFFTSADLVFYLIPFIGINFKFALICSLMRYFQIIFLKLKGYRSN